MWVYIYIYICAYKIIFFKEKGDGRAFIIENRL